MKISLERVDTQGLRVDLSGPHREAISLRSSLGLRGVVDHTDARLALSDVAAESVELASLRILLGDLVLSSAEGATAPYKLQGIPAGKHKLTVWHRSAKAPLEVDVVIQDGKTTKLDITLEGTTEIEASLLKHQRRDKVDYRALMPDGGSPGESEDKWK